MKYLTDNTRQVGGSGGRSASKAGDALGGVSGGGNGVRTRPDHAPGAALAPGLTATMEH